VACKPCNDAYRGSRSAGCAPSSRIRHGGAVESLPHELRRPRREHVPRGRVPFDDVAHIARFLEQHAGHDIVVRLTDGETSEALGSLVAPTPSWMPPACAPEEHEAALGGIEGADVRQALCACATTTPP